jgi:hypothetical protein
VQILEQNIGKPISIYDLETNEKGFINIRPARNKGAIPVTPVIVAQPVATQPIAQPNNFAEARNAKDVSIYTSYAKDIFLQLQQQEYEVRHSDKAQGGNSPEYNMKIAVELVKQAKVSFERSEIFKAA